MDNAWTNLGPRAAIAFRIAPRLMARGGYGIFYSPVFGCTGPSICFLG